MKGVGMARDQVLSIVEIAEIEGEKKYSPPRDTTKSVMRVISPFGLLGSSPDVFLGFPWFAPMIGSNPGVGSDLWGTNL